MEELNICEKLVKVLPEGAWCDNNFPGCVWYDGATIRPELPDDTDHNCWFINWALDELAKRGCCPSLDHDDNVSKWVVGIWMPHEDQPWYSGARSTKTLALAHALIALGEHDG